MKSIVFLLMLAALVMPATADRVDDLIFDLKFAMPNFREEAAKSLGEIGDARAVDPLIVALRDEHKEVRKEAVRALGRIGDVRAVDALTYAASMDEDNWVRAAAAEALGKIRAGR